MTGPAAGAGLAARTVWIDESPDLVAFAGDQGLLFSHGGATGLAARGVALRVPAGLAVEVLHAVEVDDAVGLPGCGAVVMGALPFSNTSKGELIVPRTVLGRGADGRCWRTTITGGVSEALEELAELAGGENDIFSSPAPDEFTLRPFPSHAEWREAVAAAVTAIRNNNVGLLKVVLARQVVVEANGSIRPSRVATRLGALYPSCMVFSMNGFVGASPELLVSRRGDAVSSQPLAGTIPRSGDPEVDRRLAAELLGSAKERQEHRLVVDEVASRLRPLCTSLSVPEAPDIVPLRNVSHLGTRISGKLAPGALPALDLALLLHPTPAVAGTPTAEALAFLSSIEPGDRGRYTGPVGWMDARGDGDWAVAIRCAELDGHHARLYAGAGVVADSTPEAELAETQLKLQALLAAVVRP